MPGVFAALLPLPLLIALSLCAVLLSTAIAALTDNLFPQAKLIGKLTLILLLFGSIPIRRYLQLSWQDLGFAECKRFFRQISFGMLVAFATLLPVLLGLYLLGIRVWDSTHPWTLSHLGGKLIIALLMALLIGIGEELLFRGLLLTSLRRKLPLITSIIVSSLYFAALHFLKPQIHLPESEYSLSNGLLLLHSAYTNWLNPQIVPAFLALAIIGLFLGTLRSQYPQTLGLCIGCHAGWVWQIKIFKDLSNLNPQSEYLSWVSHYDGVVGPLTSVWLLAVLIPWWLIVAQNKRHSFRCTLT